MTTIIPLSDHSAGSPFTHLPQYAPTSPESDLPMPFCPVTVALPDCDKPVLAIRNSGFQRVKYEILTAKYMPDYRPLSPWQTLGNDGVTDSGSEILGWVYADKLLW